jgi:hypothetical protein
MRWTAQCSYKLLHSDKYIYQRFDVKQITQSPAGGGASFPLLEYGRFIMTFFQITHDGRRGERQLFSGETWHALSQIVKVKIHSEKSCKIKRLVERPSMVVHTCYPRMREAEAGGPWVPSQTGQHSEFEDSQRTRPCFEKSSLPTKSLVTVGTPHIMW